MYVRRYYYHLLLVPLLVLATRARICSLTCINDFFFLGSSFAPFSTPGPRLGATICQLAEPDEFRIGPMGCKSTRS